MHAQVHAGVHAGRRRCARGPARAALRSDALLLLPAARPAGPLRWRRGLQAARPLAPAARASPAAPRRALRSPPPPPRRAGAPGLGPISLRKEVVVFKEGFRTRQYCLSECTQVCYLSIQGPLPAQGGAPK